jgi:hypothetical protein
MIFSKPLLAAVALAAWLFDCMLCADLVPDMAAATRGGESTSGSVSAFESPLVAAALAIPMRMQPPRYPNNVENPFRPSSAPAGIAQNSAPGPAAEGKTHPGLSLKGVLVRQRPMAIIEDDAGKTLICGQGDTIAGAIVIKITDERVVLRSSRGSFELTVKE